MKLKRCDYGHYYDPTKFDACPHCQARDRQETTVALYDEDSTPPPAPAFVPPLAPAPAAMPAEDLPTMAKYGQDVQNVNPPVGYLICIQGPARGQDFRLHAQRNSIGRGNGMDVCIKGDLGISRENNAYLSYDPKNRQFHLIPGEGKSIVYVEDNELMAPCRLRGGEHIEIGDTVLLFVPVCGDDFDWND